MTQPTRKEVEAFITALKYGMKVSHKPEFLIALAEGWLGKQKPEGMFLQTIDLKPGDVVKIPGAVNDRTVLNVEEAAGKCLEVVWTDGNSTRYRYDKTHTVFRS